MGMTISFKTAINGGRDKLHACIKRKRIKTSAYLVSNKRYDRRY